MKEYIFENLINSMIEITIKAHDRYQAMDVLKDNVKNCGDYRIKS